jgi:hypothetical protein
MLLYIAMLKPHQHRFLLEDEAGAGSGSVKIMHLRQTFTHLCFSSLLLYFTTITTGTIFKIGNNAQRRKEFTIYVHQLQTTAVSDVWNRGCSEILHVVHEMVSC